MEVLAKHKLFLCPEKYKFDKQQIKYPGLVIAQDQVEMDLVKVAGVCDWSVSHNNSTDLQTFLDFTNFYSRFICDFLNIAHSLFNLTGSNNIWTWTATQKNFFDALKTAITLALVLVFSDTSTLF